MLLLMAASNTLAGQAGPGLDCLKIYPPDRFLCHAGPDSPNSPPIGFKAAEFKDVLFKDSATEQVPDACLTLHHYTNDPQDIPRNGRNNPTFRIGTSTALDPIGDITIAGWTNAKGVWAVSYFRWDTVNQNYPYPCDCVSDEPSKGKPALSSE